MMVLYRLFSQGQFYRTSNILRTFEKQHPALGITGKNSYGTLSSSVCFKNRHKEDSFKLLNLRNGHLDIFKFSLFCRNCSSNSAPTGPETKRPAAFDKGALKQVYRFHHTNLVRAVSLLKFYQTAVAILSVPFVIYMETLDMLSREDVISCFSIMILATGMLFIMSRFIRHIVCIMYVDPHAATVGISHLTFWGRRKDILLDISDIIPLTDTKQKATDTYIRLDTYDKKNSFYLFLKHGQISDQESISQVLGQYKTVK